MFEQDDRLARCFASVFTGLSQAELRSVNEDSMGLWDSLATVTLAAVVQEEFGVEIDPEALPRLNSFAAFRDYLNHSNGGREELKNR